MELGRFGAICGLHVRCWEVWCHLFGVGRVVFNVGVSHSVGGGQLPHPADDRACTCSWSGIFSHFMELQGSEGPTTCPCLKPAEFTPYTTSPSCIFQISVHFAPRILRLAICLLPSCFPPRKPSIISFTYVQHTLPISSSWIYLS